MIRDLLTISVDQFDDTIFILTSKIERSRSGTQVCIYKFVYTYATPDLPTYATPDLPKIRNINIHVS